MSQHGSFLEPGYGHATGLSAIDQVALLPAAIVASSSDAIVSKTLSGVITSWNPGASFILGYSASEMIGMTIRLIVPKDRQDEEDRILSCIAAGETVDNFETVRLCKDGRAIEVSVSISPIRDQSGAVIGASKIIRDITKRKQAERDEALLAAIIASSSDAIVSKTLDGTIMSWNLAAEKLFGYSASEMIGQSINLLIPTARQFEEEGILFHISAGEKVHHFETIRLCKDGRAIEVSVSISPIRDQSGLVIGASKIIRDITKKKWAEQQIYELLREVNHRSKNLLAVVQAIAYRTVASSPKDYLIRLQQRLQALAASQDLLTLAEWSGILVDDLVHCQLLAFKDLTANRININGPQLLLVPTFAQDLGLALHELVANACRYGALSNSKGSIDIAWRLEADQFILCWTERGGPPVMMPSSTGFGTTILSKIVVSKVDGHVDLEYAPDGFSWSLHCLASKALRPDTHPTNVRTATFVGY